MYSRVAKILKTFRIVQTLVDRRAYARFCSKEGFASHYGVFDSFGEARKRVPLSREFNQDELADEYMENRINRLFPYDYPVLYWLSRAFLEGYTSVFDIGGSVGVHYHAYQKVLNYPDNMSWLVFETPEIARVGRKIATLRGSSQLMFTDCFETTKIKAGVWISAGALQYIEDAHPSRLLADCVTPPSYIILNKIPVYNGEEFVTAQNIGNNSYAPTYVYNRSKLINEIESIGYRLLDSWDVLERSFYLPGHPEKSFSCFSGMCFRSIWC